MHSTASEGDGHGDRGLWRDAPRAHRSEPRRSMARGRVAGPHDRDGTSLGLLSGTAPVAMLKSTKGTRLVVSIGHAVALTELLDIPPAAMKALSHWYSAPDGVTGAALVFPILKDRKQSEPDTWQQHPFNLVGARQRVTKNVSRDAKGQIAKVVEDHERVLLVKPRDRAKLGANNGSMRNDNSSCRGAVKACCDT